MSIPKNIQDFLNKNEICYRHYTHGQEFAAPRVAESLHVSGKDFAKCVVVMADGRLILAVVPANAQLDLEKLAGEMGVSSVRLATEAEFENAFSDCEVGAMPALGNLYEVPVWLDLSFEDHETITFNAGTHTDTIQMGIGEFRKFVRPRFAGISRIRPA